MKLPYYKELDGVRGIAALMVMFFHFFQSLKTNNEILMIIRKIAFFGQTGVSLFFVLSGFLITRILFATKAFPNFFRNFYLRRTLRIFPLYYLFLIISFFVVPFFTKEPFIPFHQQIYYWVYLQNFALTFDRLEIGPAHFWSLAVEEHFYLFWPLIIFYVKFSNIKWVILFIAILSIFTRYFLYKSGYEVFYFTFSRIDELAVGAILAIIELKYGIVPKYAKRFLLLFIIIIIPTVSMWVLNQSSGSLTLQLYKFILLSFAYFSLIGYVISAGSGNRLNKMLVSPILLFSGKVSYGLYVYHPLAFMIFLNLFNTQFVFINLVGSCLLTYAFASLSYFLFEVKFIRLKRYFSNQI